MIANVFLIPNLAIKTIFEVKYIYQFFRFFQNFVLFGSKKFWIFFFKLCFLLTRPFLWLNSSSKTKFQLNRVTRRELGAILHSISWFVLSPSSQNMNISINIGHIWPKKDCICVFDTKSCNPNDLWSDKKFHFFSIFSKFCYVRVKKFWIFFFKLYFLLTRPILWLNSNYNSFKNQNSAQ